MENKINLHYDIDGNNFSVAGEASSNTKKVLKQLGVSQDVIRKVAISMYEAEINTVIHGGGGFADVEINPEEINIRFSDYGPGIEDIELAMKEGFSTASEDIRQLGFGAGMGLPNMKKYADDLRINSKLGEGTTVEVVVYIK